MNIISKKKNIWTDLSEPTKASIAFIVCGFLQKGISTITTPIFTRLLSTQEYGYYSIYNSWADIFSVFITLRLGGSVFMQAIVKYNKDNEKFTSSTIGLGTICTLLTYLLYLVFHRFFNRILGMDLFIVTCIFVSSWSCLMFDIWADRKRCDYTYKSLVILTLISSLAKPLTGIFAILISNGDRAQARIVSLVIVEFLSFSWIFFYYLYKGKALFNKEYWKYSLSMNVPLIPHYLTRMVLNQSDKLMIQYMVGYSAAGIYGLGHSIAWMLTLITSSIMNSYSPWIFKKINDREYERISQKTNYIVGIVGIVGLIICIFTPEIVGIFAPETYKNAIYIIPPLVLSVYFMFLYNVFATFEYYFEKTWYLMSASLLGGVLNVILNYLFIKKFGYIAAGYTTLVCYIFYALIHYYFMRKIADENVGEISVFDTKFIIIISIFFIVFMFLLLLIYKTIIIRYILVLVIGCIGIIFRKKIIELFNEIKKEKRI